MKNFEILNTSVEDREKLVAEIWYDNKLIAEIKQKMEYLEIEFYKDDKVSFELEEFIGALKMAKNKLIGDA